MAFFRGWRSFEQHLTENCLYLWQTIIMSSLAAPFHCMIDNWLIIITRGYDLIKKDREVTWITNVDIMIIRICNMYAMHFLIFCISIQAAMHLGPELIVGIWNQLCKMLHIMAGTGRSQNTESVFIQYVANRLC